MDRNRVVRVAACLALAAFAFCSSFALADGWKPVPGNLLTRWAAKVDPRCPLPEHPRPQMQREKWTNLNGLWDYAVVAKGAARPPQWEGKILVPFAIESALSGVKKPLTPEQQLWYRRTFQAPALEGGKRLLLHFGAVDWESQVFVNGKALGVHRGGYDSFDFDITAAARPEIAPPGRRGTEPSVV